MVGVPPGVTKGRGLEPPLVTRMTEQRTQTLGAERLQVSQLDFERPRNAQLPPRNTFFVESHSNVDALKRELCVNQTAAGFRR